MDCIHTRRIVSVHDICIHIRYVGYVLYIRRKANNKYEKSSYVVFCQLVGSVCRFHECDLVYRNALTEYSNKWEREKKYRNVEYKCGKLYAFAVAWVFFAPSHSIWGCMFFDKSAHYSIDWVSQITSLGNIQCVLLQKLPMHIANIEHTHTHTPLTKRRSNDFYDGLYS